MQSQNHDGRPIVEPMVGIAETSSDTAPVRIEATCAGSVTVVLNRPQRRNAFDANLISALEAAFRLLSVADGIRVVFLRGAGGTFSAGGDLDWMRQAADHTEGENREDALRLARVFKQLWDLPQLTVALVEGAAFGAGVGLTAACDLAVATEDVRFSLSEVRLGMIPATIAPYIVQAIGPRQARALATTGRVFDAAHAERIGLVTELVTDAAALQAARDRIIRENLACAPGAVAGAKRLIAEVFAKEIDHDLLDHTASRLAATRVSKEGQEGVRAFLERRRPTWAAD